MFLLVHIKENQKLFLQKCRTTRESCRKILKCSFSPNNLAYVEEFFHFPPFQEALLHMIIPASVTIKTFSVFPLHMFKVSIACIYMMLNVICPYYRNHYFLIGVTKTSST